VKVEAALRPCACVRSLPAAARNDACANLRSTRARLRAHSACQVLRGSISLARGLVHFGSDEDGVTRDGHDVVSLVSPRAVCALSRVHAVSDDRISP